MRENNDGPYDPMRRPQCETRNMFTVYDDY